MLFEDVPCYLKTTSHFLSFSLSLKCIPPKRRLAGPCYLVISLIFALVQMRTTEKMSVFSLRGRRTPDPRGLP